jgi:hypothetical protein
LQKTMTTTISHAASHSRSWRGIEREFEITANFRHHSSLMGATDRWQAQQRASAGEISVSR